MGIVFQFGLDTDDAHGRRRLLDGGSNAGEQPSASDRNEDSAWRRILHLREQFESDGCLAFHDAKIVVGRYEHTAAFFGPLFGERAPRLG